VSFFYCLLSPSFLSILSLTFLSFTYVYAAFGSFFFSLLLSCSFIYYFFIFYLSFCYLFGSFSFCLLGIGVLKL
jgi:hypothetical protein